MFCHNKVPAIGQRPLFPAPDHSRRGVTFSLAVELGRLPHSHRHIFWLQHQHRFGCSRREEELSTVLYCVVPECSYDWGYCDIVKAVIRSLKNVLSPSTDRRAALLSLTPIMLLATHT